ncbi:PREDICTED: DNA-directed primase/polymerase protein [Nanorana parkeri]|uniref:DNA-directed primase/polymerase protein n=1 Tax=Nanorana parkeri TaxID=125878 RepID=UPI0008541E07|nr:PREDICTED: DNA-directed primase/polymerase protein [Nanorana parkeri]
MKRTWVEKCKNVEELACHYKRHPLNSPYRPKLAKPWQPSSVWRLFHRQAAAFEFAKTCKEAIHVFALEIVLDDAGKRLYLVTTYTEFWFYYSKNSETLAHCYEVIPADTVCKLYFDLEFYKPANPGTDGQKMVALLIEFFIRMLQEHYGLTCPADCVINLDSSTDDKFSRHLIFLLPNAAFKDNIHVGHFIRTVLQPLFPPSSICTHTDPGTSVMEAAELCENTSTKGKCNGSMDVTEEYCDLSSFLVRDKNGGKQPFIDLGVYTKNRNFRLYKSSKLGKNAVFELAEDNKFFGKPPKHVSAEEHIFLCSLISNVRFTDCLKILTCTSPSDRNGSGRVSSGGSLISAGSVMNGYQSSPYPEIDQFIWSLVTREGFQGGIRQWNYFASEELLVYDTANYRWCENIWRAHKSNNVMLLVDLKRDVWYQKCHDPICRAQNFKSNSYPLPSEVCLPTIFKEEDEDCCLAMDENGNIKKTQQLAIHTKQHLSGESEEQIGTCEPDWDDCIDDACMLEAAEDAELADIVDHSLSEWNLERADIPDELLLEAMGDQDTSVEQ